MHTNTQSEPHTYKTIPITQEPRPFFHEHIPTHTCMSCAHVYARTHTHTHTHTQRVKHAEAHRKQLFEDHLNSHQKDQRELLSMSVTFVHVSVCVCVCDLCVTT